MPGHVHHQHWQTVIATGNQQLKNTYPSVGLEMQLRLQQMYEDTHQAMLELDARVLDVPWLWKHTYYFR